MTTRLITETITKTLNEKGNEVKTTIGLQTAIFDSSGNEIGSVHIHQGGGSFNINVPNFNVKAVHDGVINLFIPKKK